MSTVEKLVERLQKRFENILACNILHDQVVLDINRSDLLVYCQILRDEPDFRFEQLMDICVVDYLDYGVGEWATDSTTRQGFSRGVDQIYVGAGRRARPDERAHPDERARFNVVYQLLSITRNQRLRIHVAVSGNEPHVPSVHRIWHSADWYEREAFDLFGVIFDGHPDLRRILTDYGFIGHPFRKDFPLIGEVEMRYDAALERVVYEPVSIEPRTLVPKVIRHIVQETK